MAEPRILACGVDWLELGFYCEIGSGLVERLVSTWESAGRPPAGASVDVAGVPHAIKAAGFPWQVIATCPGLWTWRAARRGPNDPAPNVSLQLRSELLWSDGAAGAVDLAAATLWPFLGARPTRNVVTRVDLCADWSGWFPGFAETEHFVRRVRDFDAEWIPTWTARESMRRAAATSARRALREELAAIRPAAPGQAAPSLDAAALRVADAAIKALAKAARRRLEASETAADLQATVTAHHQGRTFTGWSFGKRGDLGGRLYLKDVEILRQSQKWWLFDVYAAACESEAPELAATFRALSDAAGRGKKPRSPVPVGRLEFQARRPVLRALGAGDLEALWRLMPGLWARWAGDWLTLRVPSRTRPTNWPIRPEWQAIAAAPFHDDRHPVVRERRSAVNAERSLQAAVRAVARCVAVDGRDAWSREDVAVGFAAVAETAEAWLADRDVSFSRLVSEYMAAARRPAAVEGEPLGLP